jgi:hypothetical protein
MLCKKRVNTTVAMPVLRGIPMGRGVDIQDVDVMLNYSANP